MFVRYLMELVRQGEYRQCNDLLRRSNLSDSEITDLIHMDIIGLIPITESNESMELLLNLHSLICFACGPYFVHCETNRLRHIIDHLIRWAIWTPDIGHRHFRVLISVSIQNPDLYFDTVVAYYELRCLARSGELPVRDIINELLESSEDLSGLRHISVSDVESLERKLNRSDGRSSRFSHEVVYQNHLTVLLVHSLGVLRRFRGSSRERNVKSLPIVKAIHTITEAHRIVLNNWFELTNPSPTADMFIRPDDECKNRDKQSNRIPRSSNAFRIYSSQAGKKDSEVTRLHQENQKLREELRIALNTAASKMGKDHHLHLSVVEATAAAAVSNKNKNNNLFVRLANQLKRKAQKGGKFEDISCRCRSSDLVQAYKTLYSQHRVEVLEALSLFENDVLSSDQLKSKLLFSVIVLAFRAAHAHANELRLKMNRILQIDCHPPTSRNTKHKESSNQHSSCLGPTAEEEIVESIDVYIRKTVDTFDITSVVQSVEVQIWSTLQEHITLLKSCRQFLEYINHCCRTAWGLVNQTPPFLIEFRIRQFDPRVHERFHTSTNDTSNSISEYIWPALIDSGDMTCSSKGFVVTSAPAELNRPTKTPQHRQSA